MSVGLRGKIIIPVVILFIAIFSIQVFYTKVILENTLSAEFKSKGIAVAKSISSSVQDTLLNRDASTIQGFIDEYRDLKGVEYIYIVNENKEVIAHTFSPNVPTFILTKILQTDSNVMFESDFKVNGIIVNGSDVLEIQVPILAGLLGNIYLGMGIGKIRNEILYPLFWNSLAYSSLLVFICVILLVFLVYKMLKPIIVLTNTTKKIIKTKDLGVQIDSYHQDEIGDLAKSFNEMVIMLKDYTTNLEDIVESRTKVIEQQQMTLYETSRLTALGEMAGGIAHEINNPLAIINMTSHSIKKMIDKKMLTDEKLIDSLNDIEKTILRMTKIIKGLNTVSRDSSEQSLKHTLISEIFDDVLSLSLQRFKNSGIEFIFDSESPELGLFLYCDQVQISQVLINLIGNAYDAIQDSESRKDGEDCWIKIFFDKTDLYFQIKIMDSGKGVPEDYKAKIFNPFFTSKDIGKGTGLGLSISRNILQGHDGDLLLDEECENTCFVLCFAIENISTDV